MLSSLISSCVHTPRAHIRGQRPALVSWLTCSDFSLGGGLRGQNWEAENYAPLLARCLELELGKRATEATAERQSRIYPPVGLGSFLTWPSRNPYLCVLAHWAQLGLDSRRSSIYLWAARHCVAFLIWLKFMKNYGRFLPSCIGLLF